MEKRPKQRIEESRRLEERINELRPLMHMAYDDPLNIPRHLWPEGWEYFWVMESYMGTPYSGRIIEMRKKGWTPVPADRHPDLAFDDIFDRGSHLKGYIVHKGLVLFERPTVIGDEERKKRQEHNMKILCSMPGTEDFMSEPDIRGRFLGEQLPVIQNQYGKG